MSPQQKVAVVTGGASGIGRAVCQQLAADGAAVAVWDLDGDGAAETVDLIAEAGGRAIACAGDASSREDIERCVAETHEAFGPISILVNNAGITVFSPFLELTDEVFERTLRINLKGPFYCTQAILPDMLEAGWGRVINVTSSSAQTGAYKLTHYSASKGGVIAFTKSLALEVAARGITVNNVPPNFIVTPMLHGANINVEKGASESPMRRAGRPEDIAAACAFLASDGAGYITGQTLGVNGGRVIS